MYLHTNAKRSNQDTTIPGFIRIVERVSTSLRVKVVKTQISAGIFNRAFVLGRGASVRVEPTGG